MRRFNIETEPFRGDPPIFWVWAEQRGQHHHLIFTGRHLGHGQDLVLGLWVADVQHGCRASPVLNQRAGSPVSQLHWEVRSQLTLDVLCENLSKEQMSNKEETGYSNKTNTTAGVLQHLLLSSLLNQAHPLLPPPFLKTKRLSVKQWQKHKCMQRTWFKLLLLPVSVGWLFWATFPKKYSWTLTFCEISK